MGHGIQPCSATANLVSGELDKGIALGNDISYQRKDVYGYCFETPAGALSEEVNGDSKYDNIFNIINQSDPVPYVAPAAWDLADMVLIDICRLRSQNRKIMQI